MWPSLLHTYRLLTEVLAGLFVLTAAVVIAGLIVLLVRFLLIGTQAAQIYVAKNQPVASSAPPPSAPPSGARAASVPDGPPGAPAPPAPPAASAPPVGDEAV